MNVLEAWYGHGENANGVIKVLWRYVTKATCNAPSTEGGLGAENAKTTTISKPE